MAYYTRRQREIVCDAMWSAAWRLGDRGQILAVAQAQADDTGHEVSVYGGPDGSDLLVQVKPASSVPAPPPTPRTVLAWVERNLQPADEED